jgi:non-canonical purine NTP pyrophosphatase (RdgB/HAM1 family)
MSDRRALCFVTSNPHKLREASAYLPLPVEGVPAELDELQTTDLRALVGHKTEQAFVQVRRPVIVEDTVLEFHAWQALPGPFSKYFVENLGLEGMVRALSAFSDRSAEAVSGVGYHDGRTVRYFEGRVSGQVVAPRGGGGFGWDPLFQPDGWALTYGEMSAEQKRSCSMRIRALEALAAHLARHPLDSQGGA